jgi:hypothetical protein
VPTTEQSFIGVAIRDQTSRAIEREIIPGPLKEDEDPILELDQRHDVYDQPQEPGRKAGEFESSKIGNGSASTDSRHASLVPVAEGRV